MDTFFCFLTIAGSFYNVPKNQIANAKFSNKPCGELFIEQIDNEMSRDKKKSNAVCQSAENHGADTLVTACPLCMYNLVKNGSPVPVVYFTELLAEALGVKEENDAE